jgi:hypothetical protein
MFVTFIAVTGFSQKFTLPIALSSNPEMYNFDDGSYMLHVDTKITESKIERRLMVFDENGSTTQEKTIAPESEWDFSNGSRKLQNKDAIHSIIDTKHKICYTLYTAEDQMKVFITGMEFNPKEVLIQSDVFKKKYSGLSFGDVYLTQHSHLSYFDSEGNPSWLIQKNTGGFVFVKFDIRSEQSTVKFVEMTTEYSTSGYKFIGRKDNKAWMAEIIDRGPAKEAYKLKLFSIDESGTMKEEATHTLPKRKDVHHTNINDVFSKDGNDQLLFTISHHSGKVDQGIIFEVDFIRIDEEMTVAKWDVKSSAYYSPTPKFIHHRTPERIDRFVFDNGSTGLFVDVNFEDKQVLKVEGVKLERVAWANREVWNFLLYWDELSETQQKSITTFIPEPNTQFVFKRTNGKFVIFHGYNLYNGDKDKVDTYIEVVN